MLAIILSLISLSFALVPPISRKEVAVGSSSLPDFILDVDLYYSDNQCQVELPGFMPAVRFAQPQASCTYDVYFGLYISMVCQTDGRLKEDCYAATDSTCSGPTVACTSNRHTVYYYNGECVTDSGVPDMWRIYWGPGVCDPQTSEAAESKVGQEHGKAASEEVSVGQGETFLQSILYSNENSKLLNNAVNIFALIGVASIVAFAYKRMTKKPEFQPVQEVDNI